MPISPLKKKPELYADMRKDFALSPVSEDLARKTNEEAVKESIKNIILTNKGERLMQPWFGSDVRNMLFENMTPDVLVILKDTISDAIENFEPRCNLIDVDVTGDLDGHTLDVAIVFAVLNREEPVTFTIQLDRVR